MRRKLFLYLYLALACFIGLFIVVFVDGYMGIYDTLYTTADESKQKIELYHWQMFDGEWTRNAPWGEKVFCRYEISNREFSTYSADIEVSIWHSQKKEYDLIRQHCQIAPFGKEELEWVVDTVALESSGAPPSGELYQYRVVIKSNEMERKLNLHISRPKCGGS